MILRYYNFINESKYENTFIPLDIRRKLDDRFEGDFYRCEYAKGIFNDILLDINEFYMNLRNGRISIYYQDKYGENFTFFKCEKQDEYYRILCEKLIGKTVRLTSYNGRKYTIKVNHIAYNWMGCVVLRSSPNDGYCIDEREPVKIINTKRSEIHNKIDPYAEDDWYENTLESWNIFKKKKLKDIDILRGEIKRHKKMKNDCDILMKRFEERMKEYESDLKGIDIVEISDDLKRARMILDPYGEDDWDDGMTHIQSMKKDALIRLRDGYSDLETYSNHHDEIINKLENDIKKIKQR